MVKLVDLTYYAYQDYNDPDQVLKRHREALGFIPFMKEHLHLEVIKHLNHEGSSLIDGVPFRFFRKGNRFWSIPFKTHRYLKKTQPDVILVQGLIFPLQVLFLRVAIGNKSRIVVQHHGESPYTGLKYWIQKLAGRYIDAYVFTASGNAAPWIKKQIIPSWAKCFEILEASTYLKKSNKQEARRQLALAGDLNFLWVGRLNANKDPLTVLQAFQAYRQENASARLYMIYQEEDLLPMVKNIIQANEELGKAVSLIGRVAHEELGTWYSAADYYLSASHREGSGYALLEAMACGCVPVVTDIPSFRKITEAGKYGILFKAGDPESLLSALRSLSGRDVAAWSEAIRQHFVQELSFKAIAEKLSSMVYALK